MPNHFHYIIENVGADLCVHPINSEIKDIVNSISIEGDNILGKHISSPLHRVIQWFKTMTTNEYIRGVKTLNWEPFNAKIWQRNYYEHIIMDSESFHYISEYIINNTIKWEEDRYFEKVGMFGNVAARLAPAQTKII